MIRIPSKEEFLRLVAAYGGHNQYYFETLAGLSADWGDPAKMAEAIWPWLRSWHSEFYRYGDGNPNAIASAIKENIATSTSCATDILTASRELMDLV